MCGIAGILNGSGKPVSEPILRQMTGTLVHRGPDADGVYVDGPLGLGHRRLSILDLTEAARQPMRTADERYVLVYNGEIYNFRELRAELETLGYRFHSRTDTEVLLYAWAEWGEDTLPRLNGMFAFALYDRSGSTLTLARDRYGVKPLYLTDTGGTLLFASEIKAFLRHPAFRVAVDPEALVEYLTFQNFLSDRSLFEGVRMLPAGSTLTVSVKDPARRRTNVYWDFAFADGGLPPDGHEAVEELDRLFRQAVSRQLVSDVPVGSYLSGGMDTGSITAIAAQQIPEMHSFTVGFDLSSASGLELGFDEREKAEQMSYLFGTEHYEMVLKAGDMERALRTLMWHLEEPRVGQSYPNFYAAKLASRFCRVVLSGTGGDELFAGYPWRYYRTAGSHDFDDYIERYYTFWQRLVPEEALSSLFRPLGDGVDVGNPRRIFRGVFRRHADELQRPEDYINHSLYFEAKTFLHGLLVVDDKLSMAHSLETRVPFLDNDLVDFATRLPLALKLGNLGEVDRLNENEPGPKTEKYFRRTRDGKLILREAMQRHLPDHVTGAAKQGFSAPDASWFRGESIDYVRRLLLDGDSRIYAYLDRQTARKLIEEHLSGHRNSRLFIWSLLCLERWCRTFLERDFPEEVAPEPFLRA